MRESFGAMLKRLRMARTTMVTVSRYPSSPQVERTLSQNQLAARTGVNPSWIAKIEAEHPDARPSRSMVTKLATSGLDLDQADTARLLVSAGYWPWPSMTQAEINRVIAAVLAAVISKHAGCGRKDVRETA